MEFLSVLFVHLLVSMGALIFGRQMGSEIIVRYCSVIMVDDNSTNDSSTNSQMAPFAGCGEDKDQLPAEEQLEPPKRYPKPWIQKTIHYVDVLSYLLAIPLIILIIVLAAYYNNHSRADWTLPPLFGIIGCLLYTSRCV